MGTPRRMLKPKRDTRASNDADQATSHVQRRDSDVLYRPDSMGSRAPAVSDVILRITSQTTGRGDLCGAAFIGLGDHSAATALASDARASREPSRTLAARPQQARSGPGLGRSHPGRKRARGARRRLLPGSVDAGPSGALLLARCRCRSNPSAAPACLSPRYLCRRRRRTGVRSDSQVICGTLRTAGPCEAILSPRRSSVRAELLIRT
jgi:hypothetical protein